MVTPKHITVLKVSINGLTLQKLEGLAITKVSFMTCNLSSRCNFKTFGI